jgi:two-component system, OmpR family, sensor histidine kinase MprB
VTVRLRRREWRWGKRKLRTRMIIAATIAVSVGIGACVAFGYVAVRRELLANMDAQLARQASGLAVIAKYQNKPKPSTGKGKSGGNSPAAERAYAIAYGHRFGDAVGISQFVASNGKTVPAQSPTVMSQGNLSTIPLIPDDLKVAAGQSPDGFRTIQLNGGAARVYTMHITGTKEAVMVALPLSGIDTELKQLEIELGLGGLAGIVLAAALGWWVTRTALRPVAQLTDAAEYIAKEPRELTHRIDLGKRSDKDELGRLAVSFNAMLAAVQDAAKKQRQLVADASHELRTPLTSLRMNAEVLDKFDRLDDVDRKRVIDSLLTGIDELTGLVADTMELARGEEPEAVVTEVRWDELTRRVADRASLHWPEADFRISTEPCTVHGVPDRLERAVGNLVNNAAKFSGGSGVVEVNLNARGVLTVRDHGPGIPEEDLPHVFNRFYRSADARDRPGSGLGLAIVAQVAESHGGKVTARNAQPGPGALLTLEIPAAVAAQAE